MSLASKRCRHCDQRRDEMRLKLKLAERQYVCDVGHALQCVEIHVGSPELWPESKRQDLESQPIHGILTVGFCLGVGSSSSERGQAS
ncbi:hypothetical protein ASPSYDRAFT_42807 [Aspergillus sydowii CBS 593.65]|uniref:Uncharacterized protein n=1 Tax=Aspergillus sydowii CBS 593.65 TaxID=1036612 RepID=A0A1L9TNI1_9EURO|nr:uncharacterized protein ASPSYDRAFT_42807 [Aspergillus sydowii CBS 593.65]OJJ60974.1 hypothetical protein ASPSYDRAFT_42807 [Aspergillus sydowii CBS 593.65]